MTWTQEQMAARAEIAAKNAGIAARHAEGRRETAKLQEAANRAFIAEYDAMIAAADIEEEPSDVCTCGHPECGAC